MPRRTQLLSKLHARAIVIGFCYTQLTDTEQETNGLLTEQRQSKLPVEALKDIFGPR